MKRIGFIAIAFALFTISCNNSNDTADAYGNFEVDEITISAQVAGELLEFNLEEGIRLEKGETYGLIDTTNLYLSSGHDLPTASRTAW